MAEEQVNVEDALAGEAADFLLARNQRTIMSLTQNPWLRARNLMTSRRMSQKMTR